MTEDKTPLADAVTSDETEEEYTDPSAEEGATTDESTEETPTTTASPHVVVDATGTEAAANGEYVEGNPNHKG